MITFLEDLPAQVLGISATERVTGEDYTQVLRPALEQRLQQHDRLRLLYHLGPEFRRFTTTALWDDPRLGLQHLEDFERIAIVTDVDWIRTAVEALNPVAPQTWRLFDNDELDSARAWISAPD